MRPHRRALLALLLVAPAAHAQPPTLGLAAHVDSLSAATRARDFSRVLAHVESALRIVPGNVPLLDQLVRSRARLHDSVGVLSALEQVLPVGGVRPVLRDSIFAFMATNARFRELGARLDRTLARVGRVDTVAVLAGRERLGEGIAVDVRDPAAPTLYAGAHSSGGIVRIRPRTTGAATVDLVVESGAQVLGMKVDRRNQLWVSLTFATANQPSRSELAVVDLATRAIVRRYRSPADGRSHLFNDVVITATGAAYVTDSDARAVYTVPANSGAEEVSVFFGGDADFTPPNGIALSPDDAWLYVASLAGVDAWRLATGERRRVTTIREWPLESFDGLYACTGALLGVQALPGLDRVAWFDLDSTRTRVSGRVVLDQAPGSLRNLSTGAPAGAHFYYHTRPVVLPAAAPAAITPGERPAGPVTVLHRARLPRRCS
jgi:sugar lactone lactonase YvrE